jgi:hypothetical protein
MKDLPRTSALLRRHGLSPLTLMRTDSSILALVDDEVVTVESPYAATHRRGNLRRISRLLG